MVRLRRRNRRHRGASRGLAFAAALVLATWGQGTASAGTASAAELRARVAALAEQLPAPLGGRGSVAAVSGQGPAATASAVFEQRFGDRYAGAWDRPAASGPVPVVAVVDPTEADRRIASAVTGPSTEVVAARRSLAELRSLEAQVVATLDQMDPGDRAIGVSLPANSLVVYLDEEAVLAPEGAAWVLDLAARADVAVQSVAMDRRNYPNPEWSGQRIFIPTGQPSQFNACTTGVAMRNALGNFMTTAAHCSNGDGRPVHGAVGDGAAGLGAQVSTIVGWQGQGTVPGDFAAFYYSPAVGFVYGANRSVKGARDPQWLEQNVCFRGATSASEKCAGVSDVNLLVASGGRTFRAFCIDFGTRQGALGGDSGSAMYQATAAGEANVRGVLWGTIGSRTCGTPVSVIASTYSASVLVK